MPRWNEGLVDAFPIPLDEKLTSLTLENKDGDADAKELEDTTPYNSDPFPFFSLPAELRNKIYNLVLFSKPTYRRADGTRKGSRLAVFLASKRFHQEASYALYTTHRFMIFPLQQFTPLPTIQELPLHYRVLVSNLEMVVGSSWTSPPKSWRVTKALRRCLANLKNVQTLSVFVDFDPSHPAFRRYRISYEFYTNFCGQLLEEVLDAMPQLQYVQLDGNPGVDVNGPLVSRLREEALDQEKVLKWGREASWVHKVSELTDGAEEMRQIGGASDDDNAAVVEESKTIKAANRARNNTTRSEPSTSVRIIQPGLQSALLERVKNT